jgi:hypothetical protein
MGSGPRRWLLPSPLPKPHVHRQGGARFRIKPLIEHALGRLGYIGLGESEETRATVLVLEPASALHLEAVRRLRELCPGLPIVGVKASLSPLPGALALRPAAYLVKPFTIAECLRAIVESVLNTDLQSVAT